MADILLFKHNCRFAGKEPKALILREFQHKFISYLHLCYNSYDYMIFEHSLCLC